MPATVIDGKAVAAAVKAEIRKRVEKEHIKAGLAVVIVGEDPASKIYVRNKRKACEECGIESFEYALPAETTQAALFNLIDKLNADRTVNGILIQQPLPRHIDVATLNERISPYKDVDAFRADNVGKIVSGKYGFVPCTPAGVMRLLESENIAIEGKHCVVVGRSDIVGKPMALLLLHKHGTVTVCHSRTKNLAEITKQADILVAAVGKAKIITADMVKDGAAVIDVGMNRDENGKLCGDVDYETVSAKAAYITPVPGGVGPMTIAMLMQNTLFAAENYADKD
jgi:methylenetetrahydrofolate dehydrogenase (NADP+)/methenyltetrahydrofolate cyclohydrolase